MPAEGFKGHVATDGSLLGKAGKWRACGWAVVQLDHDEVVGPLRGMYRSMKAELEVQRTIKRAELMLSQESDWTHQGARQQQGTNLMGLERRE